MMFQPVLDSVVLVMAVMGAAPSLAAAQSASRASSAGAQVAAGEEIDERGASDPLTIDSIVEQAYLKASNTGTLDRFGTAVAISGNTAVVGAPFEDSPSTGVNGEDDDEGSPSSGAAYVFVNDGSGWSQEAYLKASNTGTSDQFGLSVAISGDTVVVGAPFEDSASAGVNGDEGNDLAPDAGAAYVFVRNGPTWTQEGYLKASNPGTPGTAVFGRDRFGTSVAISGDTIVVGARGEDSHAAGVNGVQESNQAPDSGAAYVFVRSGTTWTQEAYVKASNPGGGTSEPGGPNGDLFGISVAIDGDTLVVGSLYEDSNASGVNGNQASNSLPDSGAAYVFLRAAGTWSQTAYLKAAASQLTSIFGQSVAVSGDTVAGKAGFDGDEQVEVFVREEGSWSHQATLVRDGGVSLSGDTLVLGPAVYARSGATWAIEQVLQPANFNLSDNLGDAVGASGNLFVLGAPGEDGSATGVNGVPDDSSSDSGAAYVFERDACSLNQAAVVFRNAGTNPASYTADPIVIGGTFSAAVDNALAARFTSLLIAFDSPFALALGQGQTLLCLDLGGSGELFTGFGLAPSVPAFGGTDVWVVPVPDDPALCGMTLSSQAIQLGTPPFVLSNAQDLTIGGF